MTPRQRRGLDPAAVAVAAPPGLMLLAGVVVLIGAVLGYHPLWPSEPPTLSEAIFLRDLGALAQWLETRPDMTRRYPVREGMVNDRALELTPFEAVVAANRDDVLRFLADRGLAPTAAELPRLKCLAETKGAPDVLKLLGEPPPAGSCSDPGLKTAWE